MTDYDDLYLRRFTVTFEVSVANPDMTFAEEVFARDQMTAIARAASSATLKGYSVINVRSVVEMST